MSPLKEIPQSATTMVFTLLGFAIGVFCVVATMLVAS